MVTAVTELPDGHLVMMLDGERVLAGTWVVMPTSLSSRATSAMVRSMDVDAFIIEFDAANLAAALRPRLVGRTRVDPTPAAQLEETLQ